MLKEPKIRSRKHRQFIASLPCAVCRGTDVQAAHIRSGNGAGMGLKSGDDCCVPLCVTCHSFQHLIGSEVEYWKNFGGIRKATRLAKDLWSVSGDRDKAMEKIASFK